MTKNSDDENLWFLQPHEKIVEMRNNLPPQQTPEASKLLECLEIARGQDCENRFLQSVLDYMKVGMTFNMAVTAAIEDWDIQWTNKNEESVSKNTENS